MAGTQHVRDAYFDRAMDMAEHAQQQANRWIAIAHDYGAALNYICCLIECQDGKYSLKDGFDMQYLTSLIQGDRP